MGYYSGLLSVIERVGDRVGRPFELVFFPLAVGLVTNAFLGNLLWGIATANHPEFPWLTKHLMAAMLEPFTTKLFPAVLMVAMVRVFYPELRFRVRVRSIHYALSLGLLFGLAEVLLVKVPHNLNDPLHLVTICGIPTALMHGFTGLVVASGLFWMIDYSPPEQVTVMGRDVGDRVFWAILTTVVGLGTALVLHVWWNTGGTDLVYEVLGLGWC